MNADIMQCSCVNWRPESAKWHKIDVCVDVFYCFWQSKSGKQGSGAV